MDTIIYLVVTACLNAALCEEFVIPTNHATITACQLHGQIPLAAWAGEHPNHTIRSYRCQLLHPGWPI
jgi:hypothetical protein